MIDNKFTHYTDTINNVLTRRGVVKTPLLWGGWAGPEFMGPGCYAFVVDMAHFDGRRDEALHDQAVLKAISTHLGGLKVSYVNSQGLAYIVKEERVDTLNPLNLVERLKESSCALVWGGRGSGKTSLLQWGLYDLRDSRRIVVCDPKDRAGKWLDCRTVGQGGDYGAIEQVLDNLVSEMRRRLKRIGDAYSFEPILLVVDEWWLINKKASEQATTNLFELITLAREVKIDVFVCSATKSVVGLGIEGDGALREAFDIFHTWRSGGLIRAEVETEQGTQRGQHPGPFFDEYDLILVKIALLKNRGVCSVGKMTDLIKSHLPTRYHSGPDPIFTYHKLKERFAEWEDRGWLTASGRDASGQMVGRTVTPLLRRLAGLGGVG